VLGSSSSSSGVNLICILICIALAVVIGTQLISRIGESWPSLKASSLLIFVLLAVFRG
jgi:hypothetical protein